MKKPVVDYRQFRLSKINSPEFSHLKFLGLWILNLLLYFVVGKLSLGRECYMVHSLLDDMIPFYEIFVVPYVAWYFLMFGSLLYFAFYNTESFRNLLKYIVLTQIICITTYIIFPTTQLRVAVFPRDNICTDIVKCLYSVDANTNACPSLHVAVSIALASVWVREKSAKPWWKIFVVVISLLICLSTAFIKQHSVVDGFAAVFVCLIAEYFLFWRKKKMPTEAKKRKEHN